MIIEHWTTIRKRLGLTVLNPQFFILREEQKSLKVAISKARGTVVDLGAGEQLYKEALLSKAKTYIPVDLKKPLNKHVSDYVRADITKRLPFTNEFCETVCLLQVLEYLDNPLLVFRESHRILKKNGNLIISSPFLYPIHDNPHDKARYTKQALQSLLKSSGFRNIHIEKESSDIAFFANSINMLLLRTIYHKVKRGGISKLIALICVPFIWILCCLINTLSLLVEFFFNHPSTEFPLNYTLTAQK